jgi:hypothetical protein
MELVNFVNEELDRHEKYPSLKMFVDRVKKLTGPHTYGAEKASTFKDEFVIAEQYLKLLQEAKKIRSNSFGLILLLSPLRQFDTRKLSTYENNWWKYVNEGNQNGSEVIVFVRDFGDFVKKIKKIFKKINPEVINYDFKYVTKSKKNTGLPFDVLENIVLKLDSKALWNFCSSFKDANELCNTERFKKKYLKKLLK